MKSSLPSMSDPESNPSSPPSAGIPEAMNEETRKLVAEEDRARLANEAEAKKSKQNLYVCMRSSEMAPKKGLRCISVLTQIARISCVCVYP